MITLLKSKVTLSGVDSDQLEALRRYIGRTSQEDRKAYGLTPRDSQLVSDFHAELCAAMDGEG